MGDRNWLLWIGLAIIAVFASGIAFYMWPHPRMRYCTTTLDTCITNRRGEWLVLDAPCPPGQSPRFVSVAMYRCHSIKLPGNSTPQDVCPIACAKS